jgi:hypothetical protein
MNSEPIETNHRTDQTQAPGNRASVVDTVRAFGVMLGPSLVLDLNAVLSTWTVMGGWVFRHNEKPIARLPRTLAILGAALP